MFICQAYNWRACTFLLIAYTQVGLEEETNRPILNALKQFLVIWHIIADWLLVLLSVYVEFHQLCYLHKYYYDHTKEGKEAFGDGQRGWWVSVLTVQGQTYLFMHWTLKWKWCFV